MYMHIKHNISNALHLSLSLYIYIYIYTRIHYIHIHICGHARAFPAPALSSWLGIAAHTTTLPAPQRKSQA